MFKKYFSTFSILFIILTFICAGRIVFAQDFSYLDSLLSEVSSSDAPLADTTIAKIKKEVESLIEENRQLELEYQSLSQQVLDLEKAVFQERNNLEQMLAENVVPQEKQKQIIFQDLQRDWDKLKQEVALEQQERDELNGEFVALEKNLEIWEMQLSDLEYQKERVQTELESKGLLVQEIIESQNREMNNLKEEIDRHKKKEQQLLDTITQLEEENSFYPEQIEILRKGNHDFKNEIEGLQNEKELQEKEIAILQDKRLYGSQLLDGLIAQKQQEKLEISEEITELEKKVSSLEESLKIAFLSQEKKRELMGNILKIDEKNELLKEKTSDLQKKIDTLKE